MIKLSIMDNSFVIQSLIESFNSLKDNWKEKSASLTNSIVNMEKYDCQLAMNMWEKLLNDNKEKLSERDVAYLLVYDVMYGFQKKYEESSWDSADQCLILSNHLFSHIVSNNNLINYIFKYTYDCAYFHTYLCEDSIYNNFIPICIANIIVSSNSNAAKMFIKSIGENRYFKDESIGKLFARADKYIKMFCKESIFSEFNYSVTNKIKEAMMDGVDSISDSESRAECTISILSL